VTILSLPIIPQNGLFVCGENTEFLVDFCLFFLSICLTKKGVEAYINGSNCCMKHHEAASARRLSAALSLSKCMRFTLGAKRPPRFTGR
jgi:hypothetical protein